MRPSGLRSNDNCELGGRSVFLALEQAAKAVTAAEQQAEAERLRALLSRTAIAECGLRIAG